MLDYFVAPAAIGAHANIGKDSAIRPETNLENTTANEYGSAAIKSAASYAAGATMENGYTPLPTSTSSGIRLLRLYFLCGSLPVM